VVHAPGRHLAPAQRGRRAPAVAASTTVVPGSASRTMTMFRRWSPVGDRWFPGWSGCVWRLVVGSTYTLYRGPQSCTSEGSSQADGLAPVTRAWMDSSAARGLT